MFILVPIVLMDWIYSTFVDLAKYFGCQISEDQTIESHEESPTGTHPQDVDIVDSEECLTLKYSPPAVDTIMMYCWGNTSNGELGLGGIEEDNVLVPTQSDFKEARYIKQVACGRTHTLVLTNSGQVYSCGNNDHNQLGHSNIQTRFQLVNGLDYNVITTIACGECHSVAVNEWGQLYAWGSGQFGQLGNDVDTQEKPKIVKSLATHFIVQVCCGYRHCLALNNRGELYSWGSNQYGQLGLNLSTTESIRTPNLVESLKGVPIAFIACGGFHSFAITKSNAVYGWGKNTFGQLGIDSESDRLIFPRQLRTLRSIKVKYIACGEEFSVFLTQDGGVFTCGSGMDGQLGHGTKSNEILPKKVIDLMGSVVTQVSCGRRHTVALVPSRKRIYAFGLGGAGQLGKAIKSATSPQVVTGPWLTTSKAIIQNSESFVMKRIYAGGDRCFCLVTNNPRNVEPDDLRFLPENTQIWKITLAKLLECTLVKSDEIVDQDLLTYLETVLSSMPSINYSFLLANDGHFNCTLLNHGIDIFYTIDCFNTITRIENSSISELILTSFCSIMRSLPVQPLDFEVLRFYLIMPFYHEFDNPKHQNQLQVPFAEAILNLRDTQAEVLGYWYRMMSEEYFERLIRIYKIVVSDQLHRMNNLNWSKALYVAVEFLAKMNTLNNNLKVPYSTFYIPELTEKVDIMEDYCQFALNPNRRPNLFCQYPFLFDAQAKTTILQVDQQIQMHSAMTQASYAAARNLFFSSMNSTPPFLELLVNRNNIIHSTFEALSHYSEADFKKPLKVTFLNEEAEDAGGVKKEFFMLILREILDPKYGMFQYYEETRTIWFSEYSFEDETIYRLIGLICGLAIYNFTIINLPFPLALYKKLLEEPIGLQDLKDLSPQMAKSLQDILDYKGDDLQDVFSLNFEISREVFGEVIVKPLKPNGENIPVTQENKNEFVDLYVDYVLNKSVEKQYNAFHTMFHKVCGGRVLKLFQASELMAVVIGNENYDWYQLEEAADYKNGYTSSDETIRMFWEVFHALPQEEKRKFLLFLTGSDRIPIKGMKDIKIIIQPTTDDKYLPVAHTCFNLLDLPRYKTKEKLRYKLLQAIQQTEGFSLV
nr:PREDICTED: probable E3 ubiquitin-protein ligase HERC4 isoform X2 [Bemisia tabaci]